MSGPRRQAYFKSLLPEEVALCQLDDECAAEFSTPALEASPAWEHLDPAAIRPVLAAILTFAGYRLLVA